MLVKKSLLIILLSSAIILAVGGGRANARIAELTADSTLADPYLGGEIIISTLDNQQVLPSAAYNSTHDEYLVVWQNTWGGSSDIYAQRISGQGEKLSWFAVGPTAPLNPYPNDRAQPSVAYDPNHDRYLVVWAYDTSGNGSNWDIHGVFVDWNGPIQGLNQINICDWPTPQGTPKVAYSPAEDEFMIVWSTDHPSVPDYISGRRMNASDGSLSPSDSDFTISHASQERVNPEIAYNLWRNEYLVVYDNTEDVFGTRFTGKGVSLAGGEFGIAAWPGAETAPSVAYCWKNDHYLVGWQNPQPDVYARFINADGSLDGGPLQLDFTSVDEIKPQIACSSTGNQFLVVWQQQYSSTTGPYGIRGQFVNTNKTLGAFFSAMTPTSGIAAEFTTPVVVGGNVKFLTVWEHDRAGSSFQDIHGRLVTPTAMFLPLLRRN